MALNVLISEQEYHNKSRRHSAPSWQVTATSTQITGRDSVNQVWTNVPFAEWADDLTGASVPLSTNAPEVLVSFAGPVYRGDSVSLSWIEIGNGNNVRGLEYTFHADTSPEDAARQIGIAVNRNFGTLAGHSNRDTIIRPDTSKGFTAVNVADPIIVLASS